MRVAWRIGIGLLLAVGYGLLPAPDPQELAVQSAEEPLRELAAVLAARAEAGGGKLLGVDLIPEESSGPVLRTLRRALEEGGSALVLREARGDTDALAVRIHGDTDHVRVEARGPFLGEVVSFEAPLRRQHSLLPPLVAIALALLTRRTLWSLGTGAVLGSILVVWDGMVDAAPAGGLTWGEGILAPLRGVATFLHVYIWDTSLTDSFHLEILLFVVALMGLVGLLGRAGGLQGLVNLLVRFARGRRSTKVLTWFMGIVVFFDDYANSILVGGTMRPLTDRWQVSREKLAYLIDSTAAPVAGVAVLSTWVAYEISQFAGPALDLGLTDTMGAAYTLFLQTLPFRFYCFFTLWFVFITSLLHRDFGSMLRAERRAARQGEVLAPGATPLVSRALTGIGARPGIEPRARNALLPLGWVLGFIAAGIWVVGTAPEGTAARLLAAGPAGAVAGAVGVLGDALRELASSLTGAGGGFPARLREAFERSGEFNSRILALAAWTGVLGGLLGFVATRTLRLREGLAAAFAGARSMVLALVILLLAWALGAICKDLGTARYLLALTHHLLTPTFFTVTLFLLSCATAFSTGTSWGTMALLLPNVLYLAFRVGEASPLGASLFTVVAIGAVLEGAIFGDHCSPISDTTILSSTAAVSDHVDHVRTQAPYAIVTMLAALLLGYVPVAQGVPPWICFLAGIVLLTVFVLVVGRNPDDPPDGGGADP